jgi:hypothetical protein
MRSNPPRYTGQASCTRSSAVGIDAHERLFLDIVSVNQAGLVGKSELFENDEDFGRVRSVG